jgi:hypothetical protein
VLREELGKEPSELFDNFEEEPLGTASLAQVNYIQDRVLTEATCLVGNLSNLIIMFSCLGGAGISSVRIFLTPPPPNHQIFCILISCRLPPIVKCHSILLK